MTGVVPGPPSPAVIRISSTSASGASRNSQAAVSPLPEYRGDGLVPARAGLPRKYGLSQIPIGSSVVYARRRCRRWSGASMTRSPAGQASTTRTVAAASALVGTPRANARASRVARKRRAMTVVVFVRSEAAGRGASCPVLVADLARAGLRGVRDALRGGTCTTDGKDVTLARRSDDHEPRAERPGTGILESRMPE